MSDILLIKYDISTKREHSPALDSVKMVSYKTANYELTDHALGELVMGNDCAVHIHDSRHFRRDEHIAVSQGVTSAGKAIKLDADGHIDATMINQSDIMHDNLSEVANSEAHVKFPLLAGGRDLIGIQKYNVHKIFTNPTDLIDKQYVDEKVAEMGAIGDFISVEEVQADSANVVGPLVAGYRVLVMGVGAGAFVGQDNKKAVWNGTAWEFVAVEVGTRLCSDDDQNGVYIYTSTGWAVKYFESTTASMGIKKVGFDIQANPQVNGGLEIASHELKVKSSDLVGGGLIVTDNKFHVDFSIDYTDAKAIKASDISSVSAGKGASIMGVEDADGLFVSGNVEACLKEVMLVARDGSGVEYVAGAGGITKGQLVYISSANTILPLTTISDDYMVVGMALNSAPAGSTVKVAKTDCLVKGLISNGVAGTPYFWNGVSVTTEKPTASGSNVYLVGCAKNGNDFQLAIEHLYKRP